VTENRGPDEEAGERIDFDWQSPRWRESEAVQADTERGHRFRDMESPPQRGAIDRSDSVPSNTGEPPPSRPRKRKPARGS
jgi:hypothetical protein